MDDATTVANEWWLLAVLGAVSVVAGILAIAYPDITLLAVGITFGFYLLVAGVFEIVQAIGGAPESRALSAIVGVIALIAGVVCIRRPGESLLALVLVLGVYLIVAGGVHLVQAFAGDARRGLAPLAAIADIVLGVLILALPKISLATVAVLFGISLILRGAVALGGAFQLRRTRRADAHVPGSARAAA
jgi:uncharacterized membrane protein HdeD (DUF308 family)